MKKYCIAYLFMLFCATAIAGEANPLAADPAIEARLNAMSTELRCLVCQNQTLADSSAPLAEDLRREIRLQLNAGKTDKEVIDYLVSRYGDFVLYKPPFKSSTALLWLGPFVLMLAGLAGLLLMLRRRQKPSVEALTEAPLSADEARKIQELLSKD
jgi:cytochrome c-type biogenesis protein CcmH